MSQLKNPIRLFPNTKNFMKYIMHHPCADPWALLFETALPAFINFWATIAFLDLNDLAVDKLRSYTNGPTYGTKRGRRKFAFDLAREQRAKGSKMLFSSNFTATKYVQGFTKGLLLVAEPLERIGFFFLLYYGADRFFYNWQTMLEARDYCSAHPTTGPLVRNKIGGTALFSISGSALALPIDTQNRGGWGSTSFQATLPTGYFTINFTVRAKAASGTITGAYLRFTVLKGGSIPFTYDSEKQTITDAEWVDFVHTISVDLRFFLGGSVEWETKSDSAFVGSCDIEMARVMIFVQPANFWGLQSSNA